MSDSAILSAIGSFVFTIFWFARLEFKTNQNMKDIEKLDVATKASFSSIGSRFDLHKKSVDDMSHALSRIEGFLERPKGD